MFAVSWQFSWPNKVNYLLSYFTLLIASQGSPILAAELLSLTLYVTILRDILRNILRGLCVHATIIL